jgi:2-dehydropantoate 2-reductase
MKHVLFYGSGAVNLSLIGWLAREGLRITVLARPESAAAIREHGVQVKCLGLLSEARPDVITALDKADRPALIVIGVKAYALDEAVAQILATYDRDMPVLSVLNGVRHVDFLRSKFSNAMFATICFNAYRTEPFRSVAMSRGPLVFTYSRAADKHIRRATFDLMKGRVEAVQGADALDVAYNKLIVNLANALMTMVGFHDHRDRDIAQLQHITAHVMWEGVQVLKASGVQELRIPGLPAWRMLWMSRYLPQFITVPIFRKKMSVSAINSMAQDMQRGNDTELEEINGRFLLLAERSSVKVPYNRAVYQLFKEWAAAPSTPLSPSEVLSRIKSVRSR